MPIGSQIEKEEAVAAVLERRGGICVLCAERAEDVEIQWHHLIMLFDRYAKPILDESGHIVFDRIVSIATMVGQLSYSVGLLGLVAMAHEAAAEAAARLLAGVRTGICAAAFP
jgi:hypothetical protein